MFKVHDRFDETLVALKLHGRWWGMWKEWSLEAESHSWLRASKQSKISDL